MLFNTVQANADGALPSLLAMLENAPQVDTRGGRTKERTHVGITLTQPWQRELLVPSRKPNIAAQIFETMWVLSGRDDMESLLRYLPRAAEFSDDGQRWRAGYGVRLRHWKTVGREVDQMRYVVETLKRDPLSRQAVMSIWDPDIDTEPGKDIPCNNWLSFSVRDNLLDLHVAIRSNDVIWGWSGINQFEWSALQEVVAGLVGVQVGALHFSVTSFHLYERHWDKANRIVTEHARTPRPEIADSPRFETGGHQEIGQFDHLCRQWFEIEEAIRTGADATSRVATFPEPMLRSWLRVLQWWWSGDEGYLEPIAETRLGEATRFSVQPPVRSDFGSSSVKPEVTEAKADECYVPSWASPFLKAVLALHEEKDRAYGGSWKRRGEMLGIMANIARKVDRLGGAETSDETSVDTAIDLFVYLAKYRGWLENSADETTSTANAVMIEADEMHQRESDWSWVVGTTGRNSLERLLVERFDMLEESVNYVRQGKGDRIDHRSPIVIGMIKSAYRLARLLWEKAQEEPLQAAPTAEGAGHAQRNARRSWTPEKAEEDHVGEHDPMVPIAEAGHVCVHPRGVSIKSHSCSCARGVDHQPNGSPIRDVVQS